MSTNARTPENNSGTDPRDRNLFLGVDAEGSHHIFQTRRHRVVVVEDKQVVHVEKLHCAVDAWVDHISDVRGWEEKRYGPIWEQLPADLGGEQ